MMRTPLNPYEKYELTGMTDAEREEERRQRNDNWRDYCDETLIDELEEIFDDAL